MQSYPSALCRHRGMKQSNFFKPDIPKDLF